MKRIKGKDRVGKIFGRLTVLEMLPNRKLLAKCECGVTRAFSRVDVFYGDTQSCGCLRHERRPRLTHGMSHKRNSKGHPLYHIWKGMRGRCYRKSEPGYAYYGARGIKMCDEWKADFMSFYNWAIQNGWQEGLTLDRYPNNDGNYEPNNCRFVTMSEQCRNRRNNIFIEYKGERMVLTDFAKMFNLNFQTIRDRFHRGWSVERLLEPTNTYHVKRRMEQQRFSAEIPYSIY